MSALICRIRGCVAMQIMNIYFYNLTSNFCHAETAFVTHNEY